MKCPKCYEEMARLESKERTIWVCYEDAEIIWGNKKEMLKE